MCRANGAAVASRAKLARFGSLSHRSGVGPEQLGDVPFGCGLGLDLATLGTQGGARPHAIAGTRG